jgi:hypothetical protein
MKNFKDLREKTLTPAEKKKREEIAKAMERENPNMPMAKKMAIATATAKKVAEEVELDEVVAKSNLNKNKTTKQTQDSAKLHGSKFGELTWGDGSVDYLIKTPTGWKFIGGYDNLGTLIKGKMDIAGPDEVKYISPIDKNEVPVKLLKNVKEEVELDEVSKATLGRYVKAASTDAARKTSEKDSVDRDYPNRSFNDRLGYKKELGKKLNKRRVGISKAVDRLTKEEAEQIDEASTKVEIPKSRYDTIANMHGASGPTHGKVTRSPKGTMQYKGARHSKFDQKSDTHIDQIYSHPDHNLATIEKHTHKSTGKVKYYLHKKTTNEEVEQIDELSKKTLGSYVKKAKDDLGNREAEVTRNRYVDPRGVKDPIKHNNALLMKRAKRRDNINKAVDKLTREQAEDDMAASPDELSMAMRQLDFIEDAAEKIKDSLGSGKGFPEWMQNKLSKLHGQMESLYSSLGDIEDEEEDEDEMEEAVQSDDRKPEKYIRPDGKVGIRMTKVDKKVIKND